jgi:hypothetical protein
VIARANLIKGIIETRLAPAALLPAFRANAQEHRVAAKAETAGGTINFLFP